MDGKGFNLENIGQHFEVRMQNIPRMAKTLMRTVFPDKIHLIFYFGLYGILLFFNKVPSFGFHPVLT